MTLLPRNQWMLPDGVTYLNHGSFGPSPRVVCEERRRWSDLLESEPMDFYLRQMESRLDETLARLAEFVGASASDLVFADNATAAMNIVAETVRLKPGDEILLTDHEYGAVLRIWRRVCERTGAKLVIQPLTMPPISSDALVDEFLSGATDRTKLIVVSHVTSPTAMIIPVEGICRRARERGIPVCIDGPHAVAMIPLKLRALNCDFYAASCHKWLAAPLGSGFLYVAKHRQQDVVAPVLSWGGSVSGRPARWQDEFTWTGTRDPAAWLAVGRAIEFLEDFGLEEFRRETHRLAGYARRGISAWTGLEPLVPDGAQWYGSMISLPLPTGDIEPPRQGHRDPLQDRLWQEERIEVPIVHWKGRRLLRVSCYLYNSREEIDRLLQALQRLLPASGASEERPADSDDSQGNA